jgi:hypothetical protein
MQTFKNLIFRCLVGRTASTMGEVVEVSDIERININRVCQAMESGIDI